MKILHITPHMGGGVGTVIMDWMTRDSKIKLTGTNRYHHEIACLDEINEKAWEWAMHKNIIVSYNPPSVMWQLVNYIDEADIVLVHYWDHPMLAYLFSRPLPDCRLVFWCHKNIIYPPELILWPDRWIDTSPIQGNEYIWSTGNIDRFLSIKPKAHSGFNVGYVGTVDYKKIHPNFFDMCLDITSRIPGVRFTIVGENHLPPGPWDQIITYVGKVDDVAPCLAEMDVFGYPLRPDHYGTCEQVLGEAMAAGIPIVAMNNLAEKRCVPHGRVGLLALNSENSDCYVRSVEYLYRHPQLRKAMSKNARRWAKNKYSIDDMIHSWNNVFESMMDKPKTAKGVI